ncbi:site-specific DNA-methyltransferase [Pseudonocardia nematodicida]|uniref:Methyltransferase n=1 Tax=Pseudonocardia nematodicida TaxID=1206997 RepID=A0ABV1KBB8_9PSEU
MNDHQHDQPFTELPRRQILIGDARSQLQRLPGDSIDCVVTSPPYFGLRDYGHPEQLGSEPDIQAWVKNLVAVAGELRRVLRPDGTVWLNVGDGFSRHPREGTTKKGLLLGPQRLALALQDDGWLVRNYIIWAKRNPMPSSMTDRLTCGHETVLLLTKRPHYYFDLDAIRVPATTSAVPPNRASTAARPHYPPMDAVPHHGRSPRVDLNRGLASLKAAGLQHHPLGRNPGDVWQFSTASYRGAHFAVFPADLARRPVLAGTPERRCTSCATPWRRAPQRRGTRLLAVGPLRPVCTCRSPWQPGVVLDPFMGTGTVATVAEAADRDWLGIELNPTYGALAWSRIAAARGQPRNGADASGPIA